MAVSLQTVPNSSQTPQPSNSLSALLQGVAYAPLDSTAWIRVTGSDRVRWLNGMITNAVQTLAPGAGCYNFVLNAQGQIQGDLAAFAPPNDPHALLLETTRDQLPALLAHLDRFIIMDDVELTDITDRRSGLLVAGPQAGTALAQLGIAADADASLHMESAAYQGACIELLHANSPLVPQYELWGDEATIALISSALASSGLIAASAEACELLRILEGTPRFGADIRNRDLPQETAQARALHFNKGCYLGQEIVERVRSRGNVHRTFSGFELTGTLPAPGTQLTAEGKSVGELTSVATIPLPGRTVQLALGYIRREALERKLLLEFPGGSAVPVSLPYQVS